MGLTKYEYAERPSQGSLNSSTELKPRSKDRRRRTSYQSSLLDSIVWNVFKSIDSSQKKNSLCLIHFEGWVEDFIKTSFGSTVEEVNKRNPLIKHKSPFGRKLNVKYTNLLNTLTLMQAALGKIVRRKSCGCFYCGKISRKKEKFEQIMLEKEELVEQQTLNIKRS